MMYASHIPISPSLRSKYIQNYRFDQGNGDQQYNGEHNISGNSFFDNPINPHEEFANTYRNSYRGDVATENIQRTYENHGVGNSKAMPNNVDINIEEKNIIDGSSSTMDKYSANNKYLSNSINAPEIQDEEEVTHGFPTASSFPHSSQIYDMNSYTGNSKNQSPIHRRNSTKAHNLSSINERNSDFKTIHGSINNSNLYNNFNPKSPHRHPQSPHHHSPTLTDPRTFHSVNTPTGPMFTHLGPPSIAAPIGPSPTSHFGPYAALNKGHSNNIHQTSNSNISTQAIHTPFYDQNDPQSPHNTNPIPPTSHHHLPPPPPPPPPPLQQPHISSQSKHPKVPFLDTSKIRDHEEESLNSLSSSSSLSKKMQDNRERLEQLNISHSKFNLTGIPKETKDNNDNLNIKGNIYTEDIQPENNDQIVNSCDNVDNTLLVNDSFNFQNKNKHTIISNNRLPPKAPNTSNVNPVPFGVDNMFVKQKSEELSNITNRSDRNDSLQSRDVHLAMRPPTAPTFYSSEEKNHHDYQGRGLNNQVRNERVHVNNNFSAHSNSGNVGRPKDSTVSQQSLQRPPTAPNAFQKSGNLPKVDMLINLMGKTVENKRKDFEKLSKLKNVLSELGDFNKKLLEENTRLKSGNLIKNGDNKKKDVFGIENELFSQFSESNGDTKGDVANAGHNSTYVDHISHINSLKAIINKKNQRISELEIKIAESNKFNINNINDSTSNDGGNNYDICYDLLEKLKAREQELINHLNDINNTDSGIIVEKLNKCLALINEKRGSSKLRILLSDILNQIEFNYRALSVTVEHLIDQQNSTLESIKSNVFNKEQEDTYINENNIQMMHKSKNNIEEGKHNSKLNGKDERQKENNYDNIVILNDKDAHKYDEENKLNQGQVFLNYSNNNNIYKGESEENQIDFEENERNICLQELECNLNNNEYYNNVMDISDNIDNNIAAANKIGGDQYNSNIQRGLSSEEIGYEYEPGIEQFSVGWINNNNIGVMEQSNLQSHSNLYQDNNNEYYGNDIVNDSYMENDLLQYQITSESTPSVPPPVLAAYYENSNYQGGFDNYKDNTEENGKELVISGNIDHRYYQVPTSLSNI
ncbi:hypothetical protein FG379_001203 [Cryptosporidium bovis]|uniref:uncharacterized protein n=1 Tax=Cryptosporidium bovis TaxID=310047 RepID=UPI00351A2384|nr:hypothetical protein FG379_001203 [Cryptosporidium bovis]